ncbi:MAG: Fur family transcriptional regulator [Candidatus Limnocylindrales bacterium]
MNDAHPMTLEGTRERLRSRGLRWTPQRRAILDVLAATDGHITGVELVERCRLRDPETTVSTVYRTLDVLEELGLVRHSHGHDGREEFHILPATEHGHLVCESCGATSELASPAVRRLLTALEQRSGYRVDLNHLAIAGLCADCRAREAR